MLQLKFLHLCFLIVPALAGMTKTGSLCTVTPSGSKDDSPYMMDAFKQCGQNGQIEVTKGDYTIAKVMDVLNLKNCDISIRGKLTWSDDIQYWVKNSVGVTYAQRSTAFRLGGENFTLLGHGEALFFGNGQKWYDANRDGSNMAGRPISLTLWQAKNVWIDGITWRQSQFWYVCDNIARSTILHINIVLTEQAHVCRLLTECHHDKPRHERHFVFTMGHCQHRWLR